MNVVLTWVKANTLIVVFVAILIVAPLAMWIVAGNMNEGVRQAVKDRAGKIEELDRLKKTTVSLRNPVPGNEPVSATIVVNPQLLDRYQEVVGQLRQDAERIREEAVQFNRKQRGVLVPDLFPAPPAHRRETMPLEMHRSLVAAYQQLLDEVQAGAPPSADEVRENIEAAGERLTTQVLLADLTPEDRAWLAEQLANTRLSQYADAAAAIGLYASLGGLGVPGEGSVPPRAEAQGLVELFEWQWQYWIIEDILLALHEANKDSSSVLDAPAKRLVSIDLFAHTGRVASALPQTGGRGMGAPGRSSSDAGSAETTAPAVDPAIEVALDFASSFTGRTTNPLYDVRWIRLVIVVDTARMPEVFDALAQRNFITITEAAIQPVDPFSALKSGYFYGTAPASQVTLELETIWFRQWTAQFMPDELKRALGVPVPSTPPAG
ncbi:MAG: hypothetical protein V3T84_01505 [Phycisphaerales bacterium]